MEKWRTTRMQSKLPDVRSAAYRFSGPVRARGPPARAWFGTRASNCLTTRCPRRRRPPTAVPLTLERWCGVAAYSGGAASGGGQAGAEAHDRRHRHGQVILTLTTGARSGLSAPLAAGGR